MKRHGSLFLSAFAYRGASTMVLRSSITKHRIQFIHGNPRFAQIHGDEKASNVTVVVADTEPVPPVLSSLLVNDQNATVPNGETPTADDDGMLLGLSPILWLNGVAILWGSQHAVIKTIMEDGGNPADLLLLRFGLAAILAVSPKLLMASDDSSPSKKNASSVFESQGALRWGAELGIFMFLGFLFQAVGLQFTTAQKSGFLLYLNVKLVPFFALILYGRPISNWTFVSALAAFVGTTLLATADGSTATITSSSSSWNIGDVWTIAAAAASAMFILRLEQASQAPVSAVDLNASSLIVVTALSGLWTIFVPSHYTSTIPTMASMHPWELLYLGGVTTALSNWIQTRAQRFVPAERAALIYSLDPVYGAGFAYLLLGEQLTSPAAVLGASLITIAAGTNAYLEFNKKDVDI